MNKPIAARAQKYSWEKETCCLCNDERHIVVTGKVNCNYCGNEVPLCRKHAAQLFDELLAIRNEDSDAATAKKVAKKLRGNPTK